MTKRKRLAARHHSRDGTISDSVMTELGFCIRDDVDLDPADVRAAFERVYAELESRTEISRASLRFLKLGIGRFLGIGEVFGGKIAIGSNVISAGWLPSTLKVDSILTGPKGAFPPGARVKAVDPKNKTITISEKALIDLPAPSEARAELAVLRYASQKSIDLERAFGLRSSRRGSPRISNERQQEVARSVLLEYIKGGSLELAGATAGQRMKPKLGKTRTLEMFRANDGYALRSLKVERLQKNELQKRNDSPLWNKREKTQLEKYYSRRSRELAKILK